MKLDQAWMDNFLKITVFYQPSQLEATTHALMSVDNSKHHSSAICGLSEGGKIHDFSRNIDNPDPKSPYATSTFAIMHLISPPPPPHPKKNFA